MRRRRSKGKKQQRFWITGLLIALAVTFTVAIGGAYLGVAEAVEKKNKKAETAKVEALKIQTDAEKTEITKDSGTGRENQPADRSTYAVVPGEHVGTFEQSDEKVVYLTLDDGPSALTQQFLDVLDRYHVKATFFVTNQNPEYVNLIKEAYDRGHTIGMHTYSHDYGKVYSSVDAYFADLDAIGQVVKEQIGYVPCFVRFPGGSSNTISANYTSGIMTTLAQEVQARGYQYYDWNLSSGDGSIQPVENIIALATDSNENNIILLSHDANGKETTLEGLPAVIEHYQSLGYVFKALDKQSFVAHHGINN